MRKNLASFLLAAAVVAWGIWCGGQYFNEAMVIPKLLSEPPTSVAAYNAIPAHGGLPFFFPLNPLFFLLSLSALIAAWPWAKRSRKLLVLPVVIGLGIVLVLTFYLAPLIGSIVRDVGIVPAEEIAARADTWKLGNRIRLIIEVFGFICTVWGLRVWSAESARP
jgi:hypothetical protein